MKKHFFTTVIALALFCVSASAQVSFGIKGGFNLSNIKMSESGLSISPKDLAGFHIGVIADIPLVSNLYLQPGLFASRKGFEYSLNAFYNGGYVYPSVNQEVNVSVSLAAKPLYLELPLLLSYRLPINTGLSLALEAGPYAAYGIGGDAVFKASYDGQEVLNEKQDFFKDSQINRFDAGAQIGLGLYVGRFLFSAGYQIGLTNLAMEEVGSELVLEPDSKAVNRNLIISAGIRF